METPTKIVRDFHWQLARATGQHRVALRYPHGQRLQVGGLDVVVHVLAYSGRLRRGGDPIPRITVRQPTLDSRGHWTPRIYGPAVLEVTLTLDRLAAGAPWTASWLKARASGDAQGILAPPDVLTARHSAADLLHAGYVWTRAASEAYGRRYPEWSRTIAAACVSYDI